MRHQPYLPIAILIFAIGGFLSGIIAWLFLPDMLTAELRSYVTTQIEDIYAVMILKDTIQTVFCANAMDLLRIYLLGLCLIGWPIVIGFFFLKCFSVGFSICILLQHSIVLSVTRILYLPIIGIATILGCRFSLKLIQNKIDSPIYSLFHYTILFVGLLICALLISSLDGLSSYYCFIQ